MTEAGRQPTVNELQTEISETKKDLDVFMKARDLLRARVREQIDYPVDGRVLPTIVEWSGTSAVLGAMDLSIHALERVLTELSQSLAQASKPHRTLQLIIGGVNDEG